MAETPQPGAQQLDAALGMIAKISDQVAAFRRKLKDEGVADEAADRMTERMSDALMEMIATGIKQAQGQKP